MDIYYNHPLKELNTFGVDVTAKILAEVVTPSELPELFSETVDKEQPWMVIGEGSNILFTGNYEGTIIRILDGRIEKMAETSEQVVLKVGAGHSWSGFVDTCIEKGYWGVENLSLIPGTVGAAPIQNIGAFGVEVKACIDSVEGFDVSSGKLISMDHSDCHFDYRSSIFKSRLIQTFIITSVTFRFGKKPQPVLTYSPLNKIPERSASLKNISRLVKDARRNKLPDPEILGNAGSFFKNPEISAETLGPVKKEYPEVPVYKMIKGLFKIPAGWLIDKAGLKGWRSGSVGIHDKHALVVVNYGGARGSEILEFSLKVAEVVSGRFGIQLIPEVRIV